MQRDEAVNQIRSFLETLSIQSPGLSDTNVGEMELDDLQFYFEYVESTQKLHCSVLLYRFEDPPLPEVLEAIEEEQEAIQALMHGGKIQYLKDNQCLLVTRELNEPVHIQAFSRIIDELALAARYWEDGGLQRIANRAFAA